MSSKYKVNTGRYMPTKPRSLLKGHLQVPGVNPVTVDSLGQIITRINVVYKFLKDFFLRNWEEIQSLNINMSTRHGILINLTHQVVVFKTYGFTLLQMSRKHLLLFVVFGLKHRRTNLSHTGALENPLKYIFCFNSPYVRFLLLCRYVYFIDRKIEIEMTDCQSCPHQMRIQQLMKV